MDEPNVEYDVIVAGGGIAGLMAAIRASELGIRVVVASEYQCFQNFGTIILLI